MINSKKRYDNPKYHLNGTCYNEIPFIDYDDPHIKGKPHHFLDENWYLLKGCKKDCRDCDG